MTGMDAERSRIRDGVRDSKIRLDISSKLNRGSDLLLPGSIQASTEQRHHRKLDVRHVERDFARLTVDEVSRRIHHLSYNEIDSNRRVDFNSIFDEGEGWFLGCNGIEDPFHGLYNGYNEESNSLIDRFKRNLPVFDGFWHIEDLLSWIDAIEDFFDEIKPPEHVKCKIVWYKMKGAAYYWWKQIQRERSKHGKEEINSWHRMRDLLISRFEHTTCSMKCPTQVYKGSQAIEVSRSADVSKCRADSLDSLGHDMYTANEETEVCEVFDGTTNILGPENCEENSEDDALGECFAVGQSKEEVVVTPVECSTKCLLPVYIGKQEEVDDLGTSDESRIIYGNGGIETLVKSGSSKPANVGIIGHHVLEVQPASLGDVSVFMKGIAVMVLMDQKARTKHGFDGKHSFNTSRTGEESRCATEVDNAEEEKYQQKSYLELKQIDSLVGKTLMLLFDPGGIIYLSNNLGFKRQFLSYTNILTGDRIGTLVYNLRLHRVCSSAENEAIATCMVLNDEWQVNNVSFASMNARKLGRYDVDFLVDKVLSISFDPGGVSCRAITLSSLIPEANVKLRDLNVFLVRYESFMTFQGLFHESKFMSHRCQTLNFDPGGDLGIYNGREYRTTQMVVRFTSSMKLVVPKIWGGGNGSRVIGFTGNLLTSSDLSSLEDVAISTEQLRLRLLQEGSDESVIKDCKSIMMKELAELKDQLKVHELGASVNNEFRFPGSWESYNFFNEDLKCWSPSKQLRELSYMSNMLFKLLLEITLKILYDVVISSDYSILCSADRWLRLHSNPLNNLSLILTLVADDSLHFVGVISDLTQIISCANALDSSYLLIRLIGWISGFAGIQDKVRQNMHMEDGSCLTRVYPKEAENELWVWKKYELHSHINHEHNINGSDTFSLVISVGAKEELTTWEQKLSVVGWMGNYLLLWVGWVRMTFLPFDPGGISYHLESWHTTIFSFGVKKLIIFAVPGMNETWVRVFCFGLLRNEAFDASCNDVTLCCVSHLLLLSGSNLTRGRVIPLEGWDDENNANMEWNFKMVKISVVIIDSSCVKVLSNNELTRESLKLFHTVVNGLDPPKNLDCACACATSTWIFKSSLEDELFEEVDGADVAN